MLFFKVIIEKPKDMQNLNSDDVNIKVIAKQNTNHNQNIKDSLYCRSMTIIYKIKTSTFKEPCLPIPQGICYFNIEMNNSKSIWRYKSNNYIVTFFLFRALVNSTSNWYGDPLMGREKTITDDIKIIVLEGRYKSLVEINTLSELLNIEIEQ